MAEAYPLFFRTFRNKQKMFAVKVSAKGKKWRLIHKYALERMGHFVFIWSDWDYRLTNKAISTVTFKDFVETLKDALRYVIKDIN